MGKKTIATEMKLDGEQEYLAALRKINSGLGVLSSEMKKTSAQFEENADSVEALNAKNDVLERRLFTQKEKVELLRAALEHSTRTTGEASTETMQWQSKLNYAEAAVYKTEAAIRKNTAAMTDAEKETKKYDTALGDAKDGTTGLGDALDQVTGKLGIRLPSGASKAVNSLGSLSGGAMLAVSGVAALGAAVVGVEKGLFNLTKNAAEAADEILTLSAVTGIDTETIQQFRYSTDLLDVSFETIKSSLTKLTNNMQSARDGSAQLQATFDALGVSVENSDGSLRDAKEVFYECIDALGQMKNETERDAYAMDIFGKSAQELNPLIIAGSDALETYAKEAENSGYVLSTNVLEALLETSDAWSRLEKQVEATENQVAAEFAPSASAALDDTRGFVKKLGEALIDGGVVDAFGSMVTSATSLLEPIGQLCKLELPILSWWLDKIARVVAGIADMANFFTGLLFWDFDQVKTSLGLGFSSGNYSNMQEYEFRKKAKAAGWIYDSSSGTYVENNIDNIERLSGAADTSLTTELPQVDAMYTIRQIGDEVYRVNNYTGEITPYNAAGDENFSGGYTWVGENGPELAYLPSGSRILNNQESRSLAGGEVVNVYIQAKDVEEFNQIIRIARDARVKKRMGGG